jgi:hypothetical protein
MTGPRVRMRGTMIAHQSYHERRAEQELALAQQAGTIWAVRAHMALAELHMDMIGDRPAPEDRAALAGAFAADRPKRAPVDLIGLFEPA